MQDNLHPAVAHQVVFPVCPVASRIATESEFMPTSDLTSPRLVDLDTRLPVWDQFFMVAPLVVVGTREAGGGDDIAPKHMVSPMGWQNHVGFVCTPTHGTYRNIQRDHCFAITFPKPGQWLQTSLTAMPRCDDNSKPGLQHVQSMRTPLLDCPALVDGYLYLECKLERIVDGFGPNSLIVGTIDAAQIDSDYLRGAERDDQDLIHAAPLLAYLSPGRFAVVSESQSFPIPAGMQR